MWTVLPSGRETLGVERGWMLGAKFGGGVRRSESTRSRGDWQRRIGRGDNERRTVSKTREL